MTAAYRDSVRLAVIVVNYNTPAYAIAAVRSLLSERVHFPLLKVILVDNASHDGSPDIMREGLADLISDGFVTLLPLTLNGGFGWANNQAMLRLLAQPQPPEYIMLLNPDCEIIPGALHELVDHIQKHPEYGVVGSQLLNVDGSKTGSAFRFHSVASEFARGVRNATLARWLGIRPIFIESDVPVEVDWVTGASCLFNVEALRTVGLFDDGFFLYFEEAELMFRLKRGGWLAGYVPDSRVRHIGGASTGLKEGKSLIASSFPDYWYRSRRRYFTQTLGAGTAGMANIAWLLGDTLAYIVAWFLPARKDPSGGEDRRQMFSCGLRSSAEDKRPAIAHVGDPVDQPPHWMQEKSR